MCLEGVSGKVPLCLVVGQDSLPCPSLGRALESGELRHQQEDINFLSRLVRKQTPSRECQPAEFLLSMARLRISLDTTARILPRAVGQKSGEGLDYNSYRNQFLNGLYTMMVQVWIVQWPGSQIYSTLDTKLLSA